MATRKGTGRRQRGDPLPRDLEPEPAPAAEAPARPSKPRLSPWVRLFFNALLLVVFSALWFRHFDLSSCVPPVAEAFGGALLSLAICHLAWRYLGKPLGPLRVGGGRVRFVVGQLAPLFDALHPWGLSVRGLWGLAVLLGAVAAFLFSPLSPFRLSGLPPVVQGFSMQPSGGSTQRSAVGGRIEVPFGESALIQADVAPGSLCAWSAIHGRVFSETGCSARYVAPMEEVDDTLSVLATPSCGAHSTSARLQIDVTRQRSARRGTGGGRP